MEFLGQNTPIPVYGHIEGIPISAPIPFPPASINRGSVRVAKVMVADGVVFERTVLESVKGHVYEIGRNLADAIFGQVCLGCHLRIFDERNRIYIRTNVMVAIKIYQIARIKTLRTQENPMQEIAAMQFLKSDGISCPNVIDQIECLRDEGNIYSVMQYFDGGELFDLISEQGRQAEDTARMIFKQIINGLHFMQQRGVCHRDMSLENLLYSRANSRVVIIDMGMALRLPQDPNTGGWLGGVNDFPHENRKRLSYNFCRKQLLYFTYFYCKFIFLWITKRRRVESIVHSYMPLTPPILYILTGEIWYIKPQGRCGKANYISPEVFSNTAPFNGALTDMWALGIILFILLCGLPPMETASALDPRYNMLRNNQLRDLLAQWEIEISPQALDLIQKILRPEPKERLTIEEIMQHPWILEEDN